MVSAYFPTLEVDDRANKPQSDCSATAYGNPIDALTGAKQEELQHLPWSSLTGLGVRLRYDSKGGAKQLAATALPGSFIPGGPSFAPAASNLGLGFGPSGARPMFGTLWRSDLQGTVTYTWGAYRVSLVDGRGSALFRNSSASGGGSYLPDSDLTDRFSPLGSAPAYYKVRRVSEGRVDYFSSTGRLIHRVNADGTQRQYFTYSDAGTPLATAAGPDRLLTIGDSPDRLIRFGYLKGSDGLATDVLETLTDDAGRVTRLSYDALGRLTRVTWPDGASRQYLYEHPTLTWALTGQVDESGIQTGWYAWDEASGMAIATSGPGTINQHRFSWSTPPTVRVDDTLVGKVYRRTYTQVAGTGGQVTLPNGERGSITPEVIQGRAWLQARSQPAGAGCDASTARTTRDANGNVVQRDDFAGHRSCHAFDMARNLETARVEGLSTTTDCASVLPDGAALPAGARKITTRWHPDWALPESRTEPGRKTVFVYNTRPDPFSGSAAAACMPYISGSSSVPWDEQPAALCKMVEQATSDTDGSQGQGASLDSSVASRMQLWTYNRRGQMLSHDGPASGIKDLTTVTIHEDRTADHRPGDLASIKNAAGHLVQFTQYDTLGQLLRMVDANSVATQFTYDLRGHLTSRTVAAGTALARQTVYHYDVRGLLTGVDFPAATAANTAGTGGSATGRSVTFLYDDAHRLIGTSTSGGDALSYTLDDSGNVVREEWTHASGAPATVVRREFDALNRVWREVRFINGAQQATEFGYDANGNRTSIQRPMVPAYGETNAPKELRRYTALDQLARIEDALNGSTQPTVLTPTAADTLASVAGPNGATTTWARDGFGQVLSETSPDRGSTRYTYDAAGNLLTRTDARGVVMSATWDALNRPTAVRYAAAGGTDSSEDVTYTWDSNPGGPIACSYGVGRVCRITDAAGTRHFAYDPFGNVVQQLSVESGISSTQRFAWDGEDRLITQTTPGGRTLAVPRNVDGRAIQVLGIVAGAAKAIVTDTTWQSDGQPDRRSLGNGVVIDRQFDASGNAVSTTESPSPAGAGTDGNNLDEGDIPTAPEWALLLLGAFLLWQALQRQRTAAAGSRARADLHHPVAPALWLLALLLLGHAQRARADESLQYDERGNLQRRSLDGRTSTYRYDPLDRLRQESGAANQSFSLDPNGNRRADAAATYTVQPNGNRLLTRNGFSYLYDPAGNLLSDQARLNGATVTRSFTYTLPGLLKTVSINGSLVATYAYNSQHQRTRKTLAAPPAGSPATTLYRYDPAGHLVEETAAASAYASGISVAAGQALVTYVWQDDIPTAVIWPPNSPGNPANAAERIVYLHADTLGTPRKATDTAGRTVWRWDSDAFGANPPEPDPDADGQPTVIHLRFPGQYFDAESSLHYNWHRFYDPQTGRYTQSDPIGLAGGISTYSYVEGNPVSLADPLGLATYMCRAPLHALTGALGEERATWSMSNVPMAHHRYLCVPGQCGGQDQRGARWWDPLGSKGKPSNDDFNAERCEQKEPDNTCIESCVRRRLNGPRPWYGIPLGTDCQEWAEEVLNSCRYECSSSAPNDRPYIGYPSSGRKGKR